MAVGLEQEERTGRIIGAAIEVHRALGPGFFKDRVRERPRDRAGAPLDPVRPADDRADPLPGYRDRGARPGSSRGGSDHRRVEGGPDIHFVILRSYLKATGREHGLLLNFATPTLEFKRVSTRAGEDLCRSPGFLASFS